MLDGAEPVIALMKREEYVRPPLKKHALHVLVQRFSTWEATDHRDKIFALIGLSSDMAESYSMRADYTLSLQDAFTKLVRMTLEDMSVRVRYEPENACVYIEGRAFVTSGIVDKYGVTLRGNYWVVWDKKKSIGTRCFLNSDDRRDFRDFIALSLRSSLGLHESLARLDTSTMKKQKVTVEWQLHGKEKKYK